MTCTPSQLGYFVDLTELRHLGRNILKTGELWGNVGVVFRNVPQQKPVVSLVDVGRNVGIKGLQSSHGSAKPKNPYIPCKIFLRGPRMPLEDHR